jgi:hypothetical protein
MPFLVSQRWQSCWPNDRRTKDHVVPEIRRIRGRNAQSALDAEEGSVKPSVTQILSLFLVLCWGASGHAQSVQ